jgi:tetratricopeptide (TPR) repeat protein
MEDSVQKSERPPLRQVLLSAFSASAFRSALSAAVKFAGSIWTGRSARISFIGFLVLATLAVRDEFRSDLILVEPFTVPEDMVRSGHTGANLAQALIDYMRVIERTVRRVNYAGISGYPARDARLALDVDFALPNTGVSLRAVIQYLRREVKFERPRVSGEMVRANGKISLTVRLFGQRWKDEGDPDSLDRLLFAAAREVYRLDRPVVHAFYECMIARRDCEDRLKELLAAGSVDDRIWAASLLGSIYSERRVFERADFYFRRATQILGNEQRLSGAPPAGLAQAYVNWGVSLNYRDRFDEARTKFADALRISRGLPDAYVAWAESLLASGRSKEASEKAEQAIRYAPNRATAHVVLGRALVMDRREKDAIKALERAIQLGGDDARALYWLGLALLQTSEYHRATEMLFDSRELYRELHGVVPVEPSIALGLSLAGQYRYREAIVELLDALNLSCTVDAAYRNIQIVLERAKDTSLERETWARVAKTCGNIGWTHA